MRHIKFREAANLKLPACWKTEFKASFRNWKILCWEANII